MAEASAGVSIRVQELGASGVRQRLREINDELRAGKPVTKELKGEIRELGTQVSTQNRIVNLNRVAWQQNHSTLMSAARVMSVVGSAARSALAVTTAWSVASLAFGRTNSQLIETRAELERASAALAQAIAMGASEEERAKLQEDVNILTARVKEFESDALQGAITGVLNFAATIAIMGSSVITGAARLGPMIAGLRLTKVELVALSPALSVATVSTRTFGAALRGVWAALGPIGWLIMGLSIAIPLLIEYWPEITAAFQGFIAYLSETFGPTFMAIWDALRPGFVAFWNGLIVFTNAALNALVGGIESHANAWISVLNGMIWAYNQLAGLLKLPTIAALAAITIPRVNIPTVSAAVGMNTVLPRDTLIQAHQGERVSITRQSDARAGAGGNVTVIVQGDVTGEEVVNKVRRAIKDNLRDLGFTGMG